MKKEKTVSVQFMHFFILTLLILLHFFPSAILDGFSSTVRAQDPEIETPTANAEASRPAIQWNHQVMNIDEAWNDGFTGEGITIAILDTGFFHRHPDITMAGGSSVFADDAWSNDHSGHGTHIAGIIGAHQGTTYQGIAPGADLYGIKIYHENDVDEEGYVSTDVNSVVKGIRQAINIEADIIVISSGLTFHDQNLHDIIIEAYDAGILIVAASGNGQSSVNYPANYPEVVAVTAIDEKLDPALDIIYGKENDFAAPGVNIGGLSIPDSSYSYPYIYMSGSSQATPHVAGLAAIVMQKYNVRGQEAREIMQQQAVDIGTPNLYGHGLIQYVSESAETTSEETPEEEIPVGETVEDSVQTAGQSDEDTTARKPSSSREADVDEEETETSEMTAHYQTDALEGEIGAVLSYDVLPIIEARGILEIELGDFNSIYIAQDQVSELRERNIRLVLTKDNVSWSIPPGNFIPGDVVLRFYEGMPIGVETQSGALTPIYTTSIFQTGARQNSHPSWMEVAYKMDEQASYSQQNFDGYRWDRTEKEWQKTVTEIREDSIFLRTRHTSSMGIFDPNQNRTPNQAEEELEVEASDVISPAETASSLPIQIIGAVVLFILLLFGARTLIRKNKK